MFKIVRRRWNVRITWNRGGAAHVTDQYVCFDVCICYCNLGFGAEQREETRTEVDERERDDCLVWYFVIRRFVNGWKATRPDVNREMLSPEQN